MVSSVAAGESGGNPDSIDTPRAGFFTLMLGSIGVVYGDIGTSPLYAVRESRHRCSWTRQPRDRGRDPRHPVADHLGADAHRHRQIRHHPAARRQQGRGRHAGAHGARATRHAPQCRRRHLLLGIVSAALFYGDAMITPAMSVLSAVEGLKLVTPAFEPYVVPITVLILFALFAVQSRGTAKVARFFGPITLVWFIALAAAGLCHIGDNPAVLRAFNPVHGVGFVASHGMIGLLTLGAVFLRRHRCRGALCRPRPFRHASRSASPGCWLVLPALALNYLGQGALVLAIPKAIENPFFLMYPEWALLPMVDARDRGDRHRQPGGHHRRLFADPAGDPARPPAAARNPAHVGNAGRADLHAAGQHCCCWSACWCWCCSSARRARSPPPMASR